MPRNRASGEQRQRLSFESVGSASGAQESYCEEHVFIRLGAQREIVDIGTTKLEE